MSRRVPGVGCANPGLSYTTPLAYRRCVWPPGFLRGVSYGGRGADACGIRLSGGVSYDGCGVAVPGRWRNRGGCLVPPAAQVPDIRIGSGTRSGSVTPRGTHKFVPHPAGLRALWQPAQPRATRRLLRQVGPLCHFMPLLTRNVMPTVRCSDTSSMKTESSPVWHDLRLQG